MTTVQNFADVSGAISIRQLIEDVKCMHTNDTVDQEKFDKVSEYMKEFCKYTRNADWEIIYQDYAKLLHSYLCLVTKILHQDIRFFYHAVSEFIAVLRYTSMRRYLVVDSVVKYLSYPVLQWVTRSDIPVVLCYGMLNVWNECLITATQNAKKSISLALKSLLVNLLDQMLTCGNYGFQSSILETFFRYVGMKADRTEFTDHFKAFSRIERAFLSTRFDEFSRDSRMFINLLNLSLGDNRSVLSLSAQRVQIKDSDNTKTVSNYWVDFNLGTRTITFEKDFTISMNRKSCNNEDLSYVKINRQTLSKVIMNDRKFGSGFILTLCLIKPVKREVSFLFDDSYVPSDLQSFITRMFPKLPQVKLFNSTQPNKDSAQTTPKALNSSFQFQARNSSFNQDSTLRSLSQDILNSSIFAKRHSRQNFGNNTSSSESHTNSLNNFKNKPHKLGNKLFPECPVKSSIVKKLFVTDSACDNVNKYNSSAQLEKQVKSEIKSFHPKIVDAANCTFSDIETFRIETDDDQSDNLHQISAVLEKTQNIESNDLQILKHTQNVERTQNAELTQSAKRVEYESCKLKYAHQKIHSPLRMSTPTKVTVKDRLIADCQSAINICNEETDKQQQVICLENFLRENETCVSQNLRNFASSTNSRDNEEKSRCGEYSSSMTTVQVKQGNKRHSTDFETEPPISTIITSKTDYYQNMKSFSEINIGTRTKRGLSNLTVNDVHAHNEINRNKRRKSCKNEEQRVKMLQKESSSVQYEITTDTAMNINENNTTTSNKIKMPDKVIGNNTFLPYNSSSYVKKSNSYNCLFLEERKPEMFSNRMDRHSTMMPEKSVIQANNANEKEHLDSNESLKIANELQGKCHDIQSSTIANNEVYLLVTGRNNYNTSAAGKDKVDHRCITKHNAAQSNETIRTDDLVYLDVSEYNESEANSMVSACKTNPVILNDNHNGTVSSVSPEKDKNYQDQRDSPNNEPQNEIANVRNKSLINSPQKLSDIGGSPKQQIVEVLKMCKERLSQQLPPKEVDDFSVISEKNDFCEKSFGKILDNNSFKNEKVRDGHFSGDDCIICPRTSKSKKRKLFSASANLDFDLTSDNTVEDLSCFDDFSAVSLKTKNNLSSVNSKDTQSKDKSIYQEPVRKNSNIHRRIRNVIKDIDDVPLLQRLELMSKQAKSNGKCSSVLTNKTIINKSILEQKNQKESELNETIQRPKNPNRWKDKYEKLESEKAGRRKNTRKSKNISVFSDIDSDSSWSNFSLIKAAPQSTPYMPEHKTDNVSRSHLHKSQIFSKRQTLKYETVENKFSKQCICTRRKNTASKRKSNQKVVDTSSSEEFPPLIIEVESHEKTSFVSAHNDLNSSFGSDKLSLVVSSQEKKKSKHPSSVHKEHVMENENVKDARVKGVENKEVSKTSRKHLDNGKSDKSDKSTIYGINDIIIGKCNDIRQPFVVMQDLNYGNSENSFGSKENGLKSTPSDASVCVKGVVNDNAFSKKTSSMIKGNSNHSDVTATLKHNDSLSDSSSRVENDVQHSNTNTVKKSEQVIPTTEKTRCIKRFSETDVIEALTCPPRSSIDHIGKSISENLTKFEKTSRSRKSRGTVKSKINKASTQNSSTQNLPESAEVIISTDDSIKDRKKHNVTITDSEGEKRYDEDGKETSKIHNGVSTSDHLVFLDTDVLDSQNDKLPANTLVTEEARSYGNTCNLLNTFQKHVSSDSDSDSSYERSKPLKSRISPHVDKNLADHFDILAKSLNECSDDEILPCSQNDVQLVKHVENSFSKKVMHIKINNPLLSKRRQPGIIASNSGLDNKSSKLTNCSENKLKNVIKAYSNKTENNERIFTPYVSDAEDFSDSHSCRSEKTLYMKLPVPVNSDDSCRLRPINKIATFDTAQASVRRDCFVRLCRSEVEKNLHSSGHGAAHSVSKVPLLHKQDVNNTAKEKIKYLVEFQERIIQKVEEQCRKKFTTNFNERQDIMKVYLTEMESELKKLERGNEELEIYYQNIKKFRNLIKKLLSKQEDNMDTLNNSIEQLGEAQENFSSKITNMQTCFKDVEEIVKEYANNIIKEIMQKKQEEARFKLQTFLQCYL